MTDYVITPEGEVVDLTSHINNEPGFQHALVDYTNAGFMSSADKLKLDTMESGGGSGIGIPILEIVSNDLNPKALDVVNIADATIIDYWVKIQSGTNFYSSKVSVFHDGANVYMGPEYNVLGSPTNPFGILDAEIVLPTVRLMFTPNTASTLNITVARLALAPA